MIDSWIGLLRDPAGGTRMVITWEPREPGARSPRAVAVKASTITGAVLFDGQLAAVGAGSEPPAQTARFDVPAGRVEIDMTVLDTEGRVLDTDARDFDVPELRSLQKLGPVLLSPEVVRVRTLRDFPAASANPDATPSAVRTFLRGDRLLIRVPAFDASGTIVRVTARVLSHMGQPMREIDPTEGTPRESVTQFALALSSLAPGDYQIEVLGRNSNGVVREHLAFRVAG